MSELQGVTLEREPMQLHTAVEAALDDLQPMLAQNQASLKNLIPTDLPLINADPTQLWRVYSNLIANSLKHNPPDLCITLNASVEEETIYCTVSDNGVGMTQEQSQHLFDLYFRGSHSRHSLGLGLGLYLCRRIIEAHGGEIGVKSAPGEGATFWFTLPLGEH
jgi:signal transduction histidine kinase